MSKSDTALQQKAYPSASAFEMSPGEVHGSGAFGDSALLPREGQVASTSPGQGASGQGSAGAVPAGGIPVVSLAEVRDPQLRDRLSHFDSAPQGGAGGAADPFSLSGGTEPATATQAAEPTPSAFEASTAVQLPVAESAFGPETTLVPLVEPAEGSSSEPAPVTGLQQAAYPSVAGPGTAGTRQVRKRSSRVRSSLKSFVSTDQSLTKPMRGVARLAQRPFVLSSAASHRAEFVREKEEAREVLNFSLRLAETMFHYGADTIDVDSAVVAVCAAYGLDDVEIDITNQSVIINYVSDIDEIDDQTRAINLADLRAGRAEEKTPSKERFSHTVMRVVRSWSENYASLDDIYKLINDITAGGLPRHRAERRLQKINTAKKPYSPLVIMLANMTAVFSLVIAIGGSWAAAAVGGIVFLAIHMVSSLISQLKMPGFFNMAAGAGTVTFAAIYISDDSSIFSQVGFHVNAPHIVAAGLIMLLPTARLVSTVQDALNGFPLTAAGKFVSTGMSFLGIVVGLASAVAVLSALGVGELDVSQTRFEPAPVVLSYVFFMVASLAFAVTTHARWDNLLWVLGIATAGFWVYQAYTAAFGAGTGRANTAVAALVIGLLSTYLAYRLHAPAAIFYVPSLTFLLPGLSVFRGLYLFTVEANSGTGVPGMVSAIAIILSMASGVVLGSYLMQYLIERFLAGAAGESSEKRDR